MKTRPNKQRTSRGSSFQRIAQKIRKQTGLPRHWLAKIFTDEAKFLRSMR